MTNDVQTGTSGRAGGSSKLSLLIAFIAGAFAAWIVITVNLQFQQAADEEAAAAASSYVMPSRSTESASPGMGVNTTGKDAAPNGSATKAGAAKSGT